MSMSLTLNKLFKPKAKSSPVYRILFLSVVGRWLCVCLSVCTVPAMCSVVCSKGAFVCVAGVRWCVLVGAYNPGRAPAADFLILEMI